MNPIPVKPTLALELQADHKSDLQIRPYSLEAISSILELTQLALGNSGATRKTETFWQWKHQANPFGSSYGLYAWDEAENRAAALRVLMRWKFQGRDGQLVQAVRAVDTATHPDYRRQGLFSLLTQQAITELTATDIHFIFNTPNQYSLPGYLKMGWQVVDRWPVYLKILKPVRLLFKLVQKKSVSQPGSTFGAYFKSDVLSWTDFAAYYGEVIPALVACWETHRHQTGYRTRRDWAYLQWRYGQHPHLQYGVYPVERAGELLGFAILRSNLRYGLKEIVLTELFLSRPDLALGRQLLKSLIKQLDGDYLVAHFTQGTLEHQALKRTGFIRLLRKGIIFTGRALNPLADDPLNPANWDLSLGDLELF